MATDEERNLGRGPVFGSESGQRNGKEGTKSGANLWKARGPRRGNGAKPLWVTGGWARPIRAATHLEHEHSAGADDQKVGDGRYDHTSGSSSGGERIK